MVTNASSPVVQRPRLARRPLARKRVVEAIAYATLLIAPWSLISTVHAIQCTSPSFPAAYLPGTRQKVSWRLDNSDLDGTVATRLSAYLYCMDLAGPEGGMWRLVQTLFDMQPVQYGPSATFTVPRCGASYGGGDGAVRVVSYKFYSWGTQPNEASCRYQILDGEAPVDPPPTVQPKPTTKPPGVQPTVAPPVSTKAPLPTTTQPLLPTSLPPTGTLSGTSTGSLTGTVGTTGTDLGSAYPPYQTSFSLPPLPPMPSKPPELGSDDDDNQKRFLHSLLGGLSGAGVVLLIVALVLRQRRRQRRHGPAPRGGGSGGGGGGKLRGMAGRLRGKSDPNGGFFQMDDDDDDDDDRYRRSEKTGHFEDGHAVASNGKMTRTMTTTTRRSDPEKEAQALKRQSNSVRIPVNVMDMDVDADDQVARSMQVPLTPTYAGVGGAGAGAGAAAARAAAGSPPPLTPIQPPALALVGTNVALNDDQKWSMLMLAGQRHSYTSSRDDYSFMQQGYLDDFAEQEDTASSRHSASLRPGEMARRDSQMMQLPLGNDSGVMTSHGGVGVGGNSDRADTMEGSVGAGMTDDDDSQADASSVVRRYWAAAAAARAERVEERRREMEEEERERRQAAQRVGGLGDEDGAGDVVSGSSDTAHTTAMTMTTTATSLGQDSMVPERGLHYPYDDEGTDVPSKPSTATITAPIRVAVAAVARLVDGAALSAMMQREDWSETESKMADRGSQVETLTTHRTSGSSRRRRSSATTGASVSAGSRRASSLLSADYERHHHHHHRMHPLYPRYPPPLPGHGHHRHFSDDPPVQRRQRLGRSASISSSFTLSSFGSSRRDTRLYSYTHGGGVGGMHHHHPMHPHYNHPGYYPGEFHPEDPFQDSASAYAYTLDEDGLDRSSCSQAPTHLSLVSSSVDSSAVLATDPFKTFDSNNMIEGSPSR